MTFLMTNRALARDVSHYPYDDFAYSGKYLRTFVNDKTGAALALHVDFDFSDVQNDLLKKALATLAERYISKSKGPHSRLLVSLTRHRADLAGVLLSPFAPISSEATCPVCPAFSDKEAMLGLMRMVNRYMLF